MSANNALVQRNELYQGNGGDVLATLHQGKKDLVRVHHAITRQTSPAYALLRKIKKDWTPLTELLDQQVTVVDTMGQALDTMAQQCDEDYERLFQYIERLEERRQGCAQQSKGLEKKLSASGKEDTDVSPALRELATYLHARSLSHLQHYGALRHARTNAYFDETRGLLVVVNDVRNTLKKVGGTLTEEAEHLRETQPTHAHLIEIARQSREIQGVFQKIHYNNRQVSGTVNQGIVDVRSLYHRVNSGSVPRFPSHRKAQKDLYRTDASSVA